MGDGEREFKIKITGDASGIVDASRQAGEALKENTTQLQAGETSTADLSKETQKYIGELNGAEQGAEKSAGAHGALRKGMHLLSQEAPILGLALRAAMSPITAVIMAAAYAFGRLKEDIKNLNASLTTSDWESYGKVVDVVKGKIVEAKLEAEEFLRVMSKIENRKDNPSESSDRESRVTKAKESATEKIEEEKKRIELENAKGLNDPIARAEKENEIEQRYADEKRKRADQNQFKEIAEMQRRLVGEESAQREAAHNLTEARKRQKEAGTEEEVNKGLETEKGRLSKTEEEIATKQKRFDELKDMGWMRRSTPQEHEKDYLEQQLGQLEKVKEQQTGFIKKLEEAAPGKIGKIRAAGEDVKEFEGQERSAAERANQIRRDIPERERIRAVETGERREEGRLQHQRGFLEVQNEALKSPLGKEFASAARTEHSMAMGGHETPKQHAEIADVLKKMQEAHIQHAEVLLKGLGDVHATQQQISAKIANILRQIADGRKQTAGAHNP